jgi:methylated-DNA-[protein]-cysteine S-methyltransferase
MKINISTMHTNWGKIFLAATSRGLAAMQFGGSENGWRKNLQRRFLDAEIVDADSSALRQTRLQLKEYFAGQRKKFDVRLDWQGLTEFQRSVLRVVNAIPFGTVRTYGDLACAIGRPQAARAVGGAVGANPFAPIVPCHRVVAANGGLGGYSGAGGVRTKLMLLEMEAASPSLRIPKKKAQHRR